MKMPVRLLSVVLALLLIFPGAAFANDVETITNVFDGYTTNELYMLRVVLDTEIASRENKDKEVTVPIGLYTVGIDIPAGAYSITGAGKDNKWSYIKVRDQSGIVLFDACPSSTKKIGKLELWLGYTVEISTDAVIFTPYKGLGF